MEIKRFIAIPLMTLVLTACTATNSEQPLQPVQTAETSTKTTPTAEQSLPAKTDTPPEPTATVAQDASSSAGSSEYWSVAINDVKFVGSLSGTLDSIQYTGEIIQTPVETAPNDGNMFVLLNLTIEKIKGGKSVFSWGNTALTDENGISYPRHENDTFLDAMNYPRIKATDLTLGTSTGWVCYEVPETCDALSFAVTAKGEEIQIKLE